MIDIFRYDLVRKICFVLVCICVLGVILSCTKKIHVIQNINFTEVLQLAKQQQKPIFLIIGGGDMIPCFSEFKKNENRAVVDCSTSSTREGWKSSTFATEM